MDRLLVAASFVVPLAVALAWAVWYLVARCRRGRPRAPTSHAFRGQGEAVTVAELLEDSIERGEAIRLNWTVQDEARAHSRWRGVRPYAQDQVGTEVMGKGLVVGGDFPTEVMPREEDPNVR